MNSEKTLYQLLDLSEDASPDQVKKRYRELARRYHPDRNRDRPECHEIFLRISQAYEVLSDPGKRAGYDLQLRDMARRQAEWRAGSFGSAPAASKARVQANGPPQAGAAAGAPASGAARRAAEQRRQTSARLMEEARQAYARGHLREAQRRCEEVLQLIRSGAAHELLGDIGRRQHRFEDALSHYTIAAQMLPANGLIMAKLNQVEARLSGRAPRRGGGAPPNVPRAVPARKRAAYRLTVGSLGLALVLFFMIWWPRLPDTPRFDWQLVNEWTFTQLSFMALDGFLLGLVMAAAVLIRPMDQELFYASIGSPRRSAPLGLLLTIFGAVFLPLAIAVYLTVAWVQESLSVSVILVLGASVALAFGFGMVCPHEAQMQTLLFGGNVIFISLLLGWFIGDLFRPNWAL